MLCSYHGYATTTLEFRATTPAIGRTVNIYQGIIHPGPSKNILEITFVKSQSFLRIEFIMLQNEWVSEILSKVSEFVTSITVLVVMFALT